MRNFLSFFSILSKYIFLPYISVMCCLLTRADPENIPGRGVRGIINFAPPPLRTCRSALLKKQTQNFGLANCNEYLVKKYFNVCLINTILKIRCQKIISTNNVFEKIANENEIFIYQFKFQKSYKNQIALKSQLTYFWHVSVY